MSLIKQLWLAIIALLLLSFVGSMAISITSSRSYIEQEIRIKNQDNVTALALSMSQLDKDLVTLQLLIAAQFDTGYYRRITLRDVEGDVLIEREASGYNGDVPGWFRHLISFEVPTGTATIQDGWRQYGVLELESQHSFAYAALWRSMLELAGWFALAGVVSLLIATVVVRGIKRPLTRVVSQAQDISARRFTTITEPHTKELKEVAQAMNMLSHSVRQMLTSESRKLDDLRRHLQHDRVTGALNRDAFMARLAALLVSDDARASGHLVMVRVQPLDQLNNTLGHQATDQLLGDLATALSDLDHAAEEAMVGRLNGSDFLLILPLEESVNELTARINKALEPFCARHDMLRLPTSVTSFNPQDARGSLLALLDDALAEAEGANTAHRVVVRERHQGSLFNSHAEWRGALETAITKGPQLAFFPVLDPHQQVLHYECPARLELADSWQSAAVFIPWVSRFHLEAALDIAVIKQALKELSLSPDKALGINLSTASISDAKFVTELREILEAQPALARQLSFEIPATLNDATIASLRSLSTALRPLGCRFGIEHVGAGFTNLANLHDVGLAYLKLDSSLVRDIHDSNEQQSIVRGMATLCHSLGIDVIAEGVTSQEELVSLWQVGVDGATGPGVRI